MALFHKLELRQSQSLVMTPQLLQAIKLLQLSHLDLIAYVEAELERNPLLERGNDGEAESPELRRTSDDAPAEPEGDGPEGDVAADVETSADGDGATATPGDGVQPEPRASLDSWSQTSTREVRGLDERTLEAFVAEEKSLAQHLTDQLGLVVTDPRLHAIGQVIINEIDEDGYFRADVAAIAARLAAAERDVTHVLAAIQTLEPSGIAARDLAECMAIQLRDRDRYDPAMAALIAHLDLVAKRDYAALRRLCGVDDEDLREMLAELRA